MPQRYRRSRKQSHRGPPIPVHDFNFQHGCPVDSVSELPVSTAPDACPFVVFARRVSRGQARTVETPPEQFRSGRRDIPPPEAAQEARPARGRATRPIDLPSAEGHAGRRKLPLPSPEIGPPPPRREARPVDDLPPAGGGKRRTLRAPEEQAVTDALIRRRGTRPLGVVEDLGARRRRASVALLGEPPPPFPCPYRPGRVDQEDSLRLRDDGGESRPGSVAESDQLRGAVEGDESRPGAAVEEPTYRTRIEECR